MTTLTELSGWEIGSAALYLLLFASLLVYPVLVGKHLHKAAITATGGRGSAIILLWLWVLFVILSTLELLGAGLLARDTIPSFSDGGWLLGHIFLMVFTVLYHGEKGHLPLKVIYSALVVAILGSLLFILAFYGHAMLLCLLFVTPFTLIACIFVLVKFWSWRRQEA